MPGLLTAFLFSFFSTLLIIRFKHLHVQFSGDHNLYGPQKFHKNSLNNIIVDLHFLKFITLRD
jgi:hypothetical protein